MEIKTETLPTRCEICHQADRFNPNTAICNRCYKVIQTNGSSFVTNENNQTATRQTILCGTGTMAYFAIIFETILIFSGLSYLYFKDGLEPYSVMGYIIRNQWILIIIGINAIICIYLSRIGLKSYKHEKNNDQNIIIDKLGFWGGVVNIFTTSILFVLTVYL
jgi:hypothetical protein